MLNQSRLLAYTLFLSLAACSGGASNSRLDYKEAKNLTSLDIPPDLAAPENNGVSELPGSNGQDGVLPQIAGINIAHEANMRWLQVNEPVELLWPRLRNFWSTIGLEVALDKPALGILETAWAENRADAPGGFLTGVIKSVFKNAYAAGTRDKYRLRLERNAQGGSEIFISHYGLKEVVVTKGEAFGTDTMGWEVRPSDPELVAEVFSRLVLYLGGSEQLASEAKVVEADGLPRAHIDGSQLVLDEGFARSWRRTGIALDSIGLVVEDRDRSQGIYYVSKVELLPKEEGKGWFSSIFSSDEKGDETPKQLQVRLHGDEERTELTILNMDGTPRQDELAGEMLKRLQQELK